MQSNDTAGSCAELFAAQVILLGQLYPGRVVVGSVSGIRCVVEGGFKPYWVCVIHPGLTAADKAQVDEWVDNDQYQFNVLLIEDEDASRRLHSHIL